MTTAELVPLDVHNAEHWPKFGDPDTRPNGLACPTCGGELSDKDSLFFLVSWPPQKSVVCFHCGWDGTRIVK